MAYIRFSIPRTGVKPVTGSFTITPGLMNCFIKADPKLILPGEWQFIAKLRN
jgi:hypothetical protein